MNPCPKHPKALNDGDCIDCLREEVFNLRARDSKVQARVKALVEAGEAIIAWDKVLALSETHCGLGWKKSIDNLSVALEAFKEDSKSEKG